MLADGNMIDVLIRVLVWAALAALALIGLLLVGTGAGIALFVSGVTERRLVRAGVGAAVAGVSLTALLYLVMYHH